MEDTTDDTWVKSDIKLSWAIYGGHISGRRPLGVKVNPLYQENDNGGSKRESGDQPGPSNVASEIKIETYESLPRQSFVRPSISVPNIAKARDTGLSRLPYVYNGHVAYLGETEIHDAPRNFSDFSLPRQQGGGAAAHSDDHGFTEKRDSVDSDKTRDHTRPWSWPHADRGYRNKLSHQSGIEASEDEPDFVELVEILPSTSNSPSTSSSTSSEQTQVFNLKMRGTPRILTPKNLLRRKELSVLQEQASVIETEQFSEFVEMTSVKAVADVYFDSSSSSMSVSCATGITSTERVSCDLDARQEICHTLSFTGGNDRTDGKLLTVNSEGNTCINKTIS